jgi:hypothetical protein
MPAVTQDEAVELLTRAVRQFGTDELLEVYNELFPDNPYTAAGAPADGAPLVERIVGYLRSGLPLDVLIDQWRLIIPRHHHLWYDEEAERIEYSEETEPVPVE